MVYDKLRMPILCSKGGCFLAAVAVEAAGEEEDGPAEPTSTTRAPLHLTELLLAQQGQALPRRPLRPVLWL